MLSSKLEDKTYSIPSLKKGENISLTINKLNSKKVQLTLLGESLRDYRFVVSPDGQCLFIAHRSNVLNTIFSANTVNKVNYVTSKTQNGYRMFDFTFNKAISYDVFELNDSLFIDIDNLSDFNEAGFKNSFLQSGINVQAMKIASDKTRYIFPLKALNFAYANIESNGKSIKLCFKEKPQPIIQQPTNDSIIVVATPSVSEKDIKTQNVVEQKTEQKTDKKSQNINVIYVPKGEDEKKIEKPKKSKEKMTISSMKKVVLDPGHGGSDCGAIALGNKYYEKTINLDVANLIKEKLEKKNIYVYMTRTKDTTLTLEDRVNYSNEINPDIYVSVHANSTLQEDSYGLEVHYFKDDSLELANTVHKNFANEKNLKKWETKDRGVIKSRFYVINHTEAPSILIEIGFISNKIERDKLIEKHRQEEIAESVVKGILEYLKVK